MRKLPELQRGPVDIVQVNVGKLCNLACSHCHVEAGPTRKRENMSSETADRVIELLRASTGVTALDLTGGAPELNPHFRRLVTAGRQLGLKVIDRCNLSVLFQPGQEDTAAFLASQRVSIIASLPSVDELKAERQRGKGSFGASIRGLQLLNSLGYGRDPGLVLDLVHNPLGARLPEPQAALEEQYKEALSRPEHGGIVFNNLLAIANMPIKRFADDLVRSGEYGPYMGVLVSSLNPAVLPHVMCRGTLSIDWRGHLFDCDFNQQLELPMLPATATPTTATTTAAAVPLTKPLSLWDIRSFNDPLLSGGPVHTHKACYGCTAGAGSSCGGALTKTGRGAVAPAPAPAPVPAVTTRPPPGS